MSAIHVGLIEPPQGTAVVPGRPSVMVSMSVASLAAARKLSLASRGATPTTPSAACPWQPAQAAKLVSPRAAASAVISTVRASAGGTGDGVGIAWGPYPSASSTTGAACSPGEGVGGLTSSLRATNRPPASRTTTARSRVLTSPPRFRRAGGPRSKPLRSAQAAARRIAE
jgi:hypothetical protein